MKFLNGAVKKSNALRQHGASGTYIPFRIDSFIKTIAKIAHAHAVAVHGLDAAEWFLPPIILGDIAGYEHYIGSERSHAPDKKMLHSISSSWWWSDLLSVRVRLYAALDLPPYVVVVGQRKSTHIPY